MSGRKPAFSESSASFHSPESDSNTDYGLEFSTSRLTLQTGNDRRSSTLRSVPARPLVNPSSSSDEEVGQENPRPPEELPPRSQPASATGAIRRKRFSPESRMAKMNREIRRLQAHTGPLIPKLAFSRVVRECIHACNPHGEVFRITEGALQALQSSCELYLTQRFEDAYLLTMHRGRVTLEVRDMVLMAYISVNLNR
ncbi:hypothetical protein KR009_005103 [Drosophila setifemur]|nr:hypothetical protein KR009_005103 [Drosophila setifemur]